MDYFFGIGPWELAVIFLVAFIILGPHRFIETCRSTGRFLGRIRRMGSEFISMIELEDVKDKHERKRGER